MGRSCHACRAAARRRPGGHRPRGRLAGRRSAFGGGRAIGGAVAAPGHAALGAGWRTGRTSLAGPSRMATPARRSRSTRSCGMTPSAGKRFSRDFRNHDARAPLGTAAFGADRLRHSKGAGSRPAKVCRSRTAAFRCASSAASPCRTPGDGPARRGFAPVGDRRKASRPCGAEPRGHRCVRPAGSAAVNPALPVAANALNPAAARAGRPACGLRPGTGAGLRCCFEAPRRWDCPR